MSINTIQLASNYHLFYQPNRGFDKCLTRIIYIQFNNGFQFIGFLEIDSNRQ